MATLDMDAKQLAELVYNYQRELTPETPEPCEWAALPRFEKERWIASVRLAQMQLADDEHDLKKETREERKYTARFFARPGEAEWGC